MLKIYLNENLSWRVAKALREYGLDVINSHETGMNTEDDDVQFEFAISEERTVVTNNFNHFIELYKEYASAGKDHYGIIFTTQLTLPILIKRLKNLLQILTLDQVKNQVRWLNEFE